MVGASYEQSWVWDPKINFTVKSIYHLLKFTRVSRALAKPLQKAHTSLKVRDFI